MKNYFLFVVALILAATYAIAENETTQSMGNITLGTNEEINNTDIAANEEVQKIQKDAIDDETSKETEIISESNFGAKVRLLQLKKSAIKSRIIAEEINKIISQKGAPVTELNGIIEEMKLIETELNSFGEGIDFSAEHFVEIKRDLKDLNLEFKMIANKNLTPEDKKNLLDSLKNNTELSGLQDDIHLALKNLNSERVEKLLDKMNAADENLTENIRNGNISKEEVKNKLKNMFQGLGNKEKEKVKETLKEKNDERIQLRNKIAEKIRLENVIVRKERYAQRMKLLKNQAAISRVARQIELLNRVSNKLQIKDGQLSNQRDKLTLEIQERKDKLKNNSNRGGKK